MAADPNAELQAVEAELAKREGGPDLAAVEAEMRRRESKPSSKLSVIRNAAYKGVAGLPDMILNAPNNVINLGRAGVGSVAAAFGRADLAPDIVPNPDLARQGMEWAGLIRPEIVPQGFGQKAADVLTQGAVGGALTGGASILRTLIGSGMGALSAGAAAGTEAVTGSPAMGAVAGLAAPAGAARLVGGGGSKLSPEKQLLKDEGVLMTPGQIRGGALKRLEDAATSWPVLGDIVKGAQRRSLESFSVAAINRGLAPIGEKLPPGMTGNKAIEYAYHKLGEKYDALLPNLRGDLDAVPGAGGLPRQAGQAAPPSFRQELDNLKALAQNMPEPQRGQVMRIIDREIIERFTPQGKASGETLKQIEEKLGSIAADYRQSKDYDVRNVGAAVKEAQSAMRRMVEHVNPQHQGELAKINEGYAQFKRVQNAAGSVAAPDGVFTPAHLHRSVKAGDKSKDKARFAEGNALMQDLSSAGKTVLPSSVPDSGTPLRAAVAYAASHPIKAAGLGIPMSLATIPYTSLGQRLAQHLMTNPNSPLSDVAARVSAPVTAGALSQRRLEQELDQ